MFRLFGAFFRRKKNRNLYPFKTRKLIVNYQGFPDIKVEDDCLNCLKCQKMCPAETIKFSDKDGRASATYSMADCMNCFICREICHRHRVAVIRNFEIAEFSRNRLIWSSEDQPRSIQRL